MTKRYSRASAAVVCLLLTSLPATFANAQTFLTSWGSYGSGDGQFRGAIGVAVSGSGQVYVADSEIGRIQVFTSTGAFLRTWAYGSGENGPIDLVVDATDNVYVSDGSYHGILKFTSDGTFQRQWHTDNLHLALDDSGNVYAAGFGWIEVFSPSGTLLRQFDVTANALGLTADDSGNLYMVHPTGVHKYTSSGALIAQWGSQGAGDGQFLNPARVSVDMDGRVHVVDQGNGRVQVFSGDGTFITKWGSYGHGTTPGEFDTPVGIAVDDQGGIYVADKNNSRIQMFALAPTPIQATAWGALKSRLRGERGLGQGAVQGR